MFYLSKKWPFRGLDRVIGTLNWLVQASTYGARTNPAIAAGTTNGKIKTVNSITYAIGGVLYTKGGTDDLWDLSGETTLASGTYKAAVLYLDSSGAATYTLTASATSAANALLGVRDIAHVTTKSIVGVYVSSAAQNWGNALGGTYYNGLPLAAFDSGNGLAADVGGWITLQGV